MRCQHVDDDLQCRSDATRRVLVGCGDPPDPDQAGFAGTVYMVMVCKQHDPTLALDAAASPSRFRSDRRASEAVPVTLLRVAFCLRTASCGTHRTTSNGGRSIH